MDKDRILVTVKTFPTLSRKYGETVCTAGLREDSTWVRIYPVPFRRLEEVEQYARFDWLECSLARHSADPRPEIAGPTVVGKRRSFIWRAEGRVMSQRGLPLAQTQVKVLRNGGLVIWRQRNAPGMMLAGLCSLERSFGMKSRDGRSAS